MRAGEKWEKKDCVQVKIFNVILITIFCFSCEPKAVLSEKDEELARAKMEVKNIWLLLETYRVENGHLPSSLREIETKGAFNLQKWRYDPKADIIIHSNDVDLSKEIILRSDGEIITR
jgi:hypothetical protein